MRPRNARIFDADGAEVFVTMHCLKCGKAKPLALFGLRKMEDGKIRSIPWCKKCRGAMARKPKSITTVAGEEPRQCDHSGIGLPGCLTCDPRAPRSTGANEGDGHG